MRLTSVSVAPEFDFRHELLQGETARLVRLKALKLRKRAEFRYEELDDIEQELRMALIASYPNFDPNISHWNVFAKTVIERAVCNLLRERRAQCRDQGDAVSHSAEIIRDGQQKVSLSSQLLPEQQAFLVGEAERPAAEQLDLAVDLQAVIAQLPEELQQLCSLLMEGLNVTQVAKRLNVHRSTVYPRLATLRQILTTHGFQQYLLPSPTLRD